MGGGRERGRKWPRPWCGAEAARARATPQSGESGAFRPIPGSPESSSGRWGIVDLLRLFFFPFQTSRV